jgi:endonuclease/exonuclease/phosphatase family metal-dependent hydrolase
VGVVPVPVSDAALIEALDRPIVHQFVPVEPHTAKELKVVCFNIQRGHKILKVLGALQRHPELRDADVVALQEVDRFNNRTGNVDLARLIARELEMNTVYGIEFHELNRGRKSGGGDCGNSILTRMPMENPRIIPLPMGFDWSRSRIQPRIGRRMAIAVDLLWGPHRIRFINAHLENQCLGRRRMAQVQAMLAAEKENIKRGPSVIVGDMNTFFVSEPRTLMGLTSELGFEDVIPPRPRGTWGKIFKLDWILSKGLAASASGVSRDVKSSDHKPLWANFRMPEL